MYGHGRATAPDPQNRNTSSLTSWVARTFGSLFFSSDCPTGRRDPRARRLFPQSTISNAFISSGDNHRQITYTDRERGIVSRQRTPSEQRQDDTYPVEPRRDRFGLSKPLQSVEVHGDARASAGDASTPSPPSYADPCKAFDTSACARPAPAFPFRGICVSMC
jgi:hypothetical protein